MEAICFLHNLLEISQSDWHCQLYNPFAAMKFQALQLFQFHWNSDSSLTLGKLNLLDFVKGSNFYCSWHLLLCLNLFQNPIRFCTSLSFNRNDRNGSKTSREKHLVAAAPRLSSESINSITRSAWKSTPNFLFPPLEHVCHSLKTSVRMAWKPIGAIH